MNKEENKGEVIVELTAFAEKLTHDRLIPEVTLAISPCGRWIAVSWSCTMVVTIVDAMADTVVSRIDLPCGWRRWSMARKKVHDMVFVDGGTRLLIAAAPATLYLATLDGRIDCVGKIEQEASDDMVMRMVLAPEGRFVLTRALRCISKFQPGQLTPVIPRADRVFAPRGDGVWECCATLPVAQNGGQAEIAPVFFRQTRGGPLCLAGVYHEQASIMHTVMAWDTRTWTRLPPLPQDTSAQIERRATLAAPADGGALFYCTDGGCRKLEDGLPNHFTGADANGWRGVASPCGRYFVVGVRGGVSSVDSAPATTDTPRGKAASMGVSLGTNVQAIAYAPTGTYIVIVSIFASSPAVYLVRAPVLSFGAVGAEDIYLINHTHGISQVTADALLVFASARNSPSAVGAVIRYLRPSPEACARALGYRGHPNPAITALLLGGGSAPLPPPGVWDAAQDAGEGGEGGPRPPQVLDRATGGLADRLHVLSEVVAVAYGPRAWRQTRQARATLAGITTLVVGSLDAAITAPFAAIPELRTLVIDGGGGGGGGAPPHPPVGQDG